MSEEFEASLAGGFLGVGGSMWSSSKQAGREYSAYLRQSHEANVQRLWAQEEARKQYLRSKGLSDTAVQRRVEDMKKAGINPILATKFDASTPGLGIPSGAAGGGGPVGQVPDAGSSAATGARVGLEYKALKKTLEKQDAEIGNIKAQTALTNAKATTMGPIEQFMDWFKGWLDVARKNSGEAGDIIDEVSNAYEAYKVNKDKGIEVTDHVKNKTNLEKSKKRHPVLKGVKNSKRKSFYD